jgi:hypothetical protein
MGLLWVRWEVDGIIMSQVRGWWDYNESGERLMPLTWLIISPSTSRLTHNNPINLSPDSKYSHQPLTWLIIFPSTSHLLWVRWEVDGIIMSQVRGWWDYYESGERLMGLLWVRWGVDGIIMSQVRSWWDCHESGERLMRLLIIPSTSHLNHNNPINFSLDS